MIDFVKCRCRRGHTWEAVLYQENGMSWFADEDDGPFCDECGLPDLEEEGKYSRKEIADMLRKFKGEANWYRKKYGVYP